MEKRDLQIITTDDGSHSLFWPALNETYHSTKGAIEESKYVYIKQGYEHVLDCDEVHVLEIGFGTGSNALLTLQEANRRSQRTVYHSLEPYPLDKEIWSQLNYAEKLGMQDSWNAIHECAWNEWQELSPYFQLKKEKVTLEEALLPGLFYDVVYFDGFAPRKQSDLWSLSNLEKLYRALKRKGIIVTYTAQAQLRRDLKTVGFGVEMLKGPLGKKEMTKAIKITEEL